MKKYVLAIFLAFITLCLCFIPIYFFVLTPNVPFNEAGPIGDMFAGLTMPVITIISIILLFFSFQEQLEANRIQNQALKEEIKRSNTVKELEQILDLLRDVKNEISELEIPHDGTVIYGHDTINHTDRLKGKYSDEIYKSYLVELSKPLELMEFICSKTQSYNFELRDEQVIYEKLRLIYPENFSDGIEELIKKGNPFPENVKIKLHRRKINLSHFRICKYLVEFNYKLQEQYEMRPEEKIKNLESKTKYLEKLSELLKID